MTRPWLAIALVLCCGPAHALPPTVAPPAPPSPRTGSGSPAAGSGTPGQLYIDTTGHAEWLNVAGTWVQIGFLSAPTAANIPPPTLVLPSAPQTLAAGTPTASTIPLSWAAPGTGTTPFTYEVDDQIVGAGAWTTFATGLGGTSIAVTGLASGTAYSLRVIASNSAGSGPAATLTSVSTTPSGGGSPALNFTSAGNSQYLALMALGAL